MNRSGLNYSLTNGQIVERQRCRTSRPVGLSIDGAPNDQMPIRWKQIELNCDLKYCCFEPSLERRSLEPESSIWKSIVNRNVYHRSPALSLFFSEWWASISVITRENTEI